MKRQQQNVLIGYELGTGQPVHVPLAHTFVTGQTQLSGKTTTLRAIVVRSGCRALAFITKRGEEFPGRRIQPYLPREGDRPIHWRLVETILASALGQRSMKYERYWIVNAAKGARSLEDVRANVVRLKQKAKGQTAETYELIGEYLDLVLPEMRELNASHEFNLCPGLNVMDLAGTGPQLQAMVIRACLEQINLHESDVLTVFPEAWEFAPRGRKTPASDEAVAMARKGAVLRNFLLCDSQDIAGVDTTIRQAASVWILGVQLELNELKRTLAMIPAGIKRPKPADVTSLKLGQFVVCATGRAVRTFVQPAWMSDADAIAIAKGERSIDDAHEQIDANYTQQHSAPASAPTSPRRSSPAANPTSQICEATTPDEDDDMSAADVHGIREDLGALTRSIGTLVKTLAPVARSTGSDSDDRPSTESAVAPAALALNTTEPTLTVNVTQRNLEEDENSPRGRVAHLLANGFFAEPKIGNDAFKYWKARGFNQPSTRIYEALASLTKDGFLIMGANKSYQQHPNLVVNKNGQKKVTLTINYK